MAPIVLDLGTTSANAERLKYTVASSPDVIGLLARCADSLGFAWCGGCKDGSVGGPDYQIFLDPMDGTYHVDFIYDKNQPAHDGYMSEQRLKMKLYDFKLKFSPQDFEWGQPEATDIKPALVGAYVFQNNDPNSPMSNAVHVDYTLSQTTTHEQSNKLGGSVSVESETTLEVPFVGKGGVTVKVSVSYEHSWTSSKSTEETSSSGASTEVHLPPLHKQLINVMGCAAKYSINYTALATVVFKVDFENFIRWSWNGHSTHPTKRPHWTKTLGNGTMGAMEQFVDWWDNKDINGYSEWDFNAIESRYGRGLRDYIAGSPVKVRLHGTFTDVAGIMATLDAQPAVPLDQTVPLQPIDSDMAKLVKITSGKKGSDDGGTSGKSKAMLLRAEPPAPAGLLSDPVLVQAVPPAPEGVPVLAMEHA